MGRILYDGNVSHSSYLNDLKLKIWPLRKCVYHLFNLGPEQSIFGNLGIHILELLRFDREA